MTETITPILGEATIQELRDTVRGEVLARGDDGYVEACRIWNGAYDNRRPALIVRCAGAADVAAAIGFARSNDLSLAVRGAHTASPASRPTTAGSSSTSRRCGASASTRSRGSRQVEGGAVWADVDHETQAHGLATTGGLISSTGVAGFTLGGGIGWLMRGHGLACDNLVGADVVTADGSIVHADKTENPELLWGLRGGGGNFGVVTRFELELHPVGPVVFAGPIFYPADADEALLRLFREWAPGAPDEITALVNLTTAPPLPVIPEQWHGKKVAAFLAVSTGAHDEAARLVADFRTVAEPIADLLGPMPYGVIQTLIDPLWEKGTHAYFKSTNLKGLDDEPDRLLRPAARRGAGAAGRDPHPPDGRRGGAGRGHGVRRPVDAVPGQRRHRLARPSCSGIASGLGTRGGRRCSGGIDRARLRELPRRPRCRTGGVRAGDVRAPRRTEGGVRPEQRLPAEPEHRARKRLLAVSSCSTE